MKQKKDGIWPPLECSSVPYNAGEQIPEIGFHWIVAGLLEPKGDTDKECCF